MSHLQHANIAKGNDKPAASAALKTSSGNLKMSIGSDAPSAAPGQKHVTLKVDGVKGQ